MNNNIILKHSAAEYDKKYRNRRQNLLKLTKKEVEEFDKNVGHNTVNNCLLKKT